MSIAQNIETTASTVHPVTPDVSSHFEHPISCPPTNLYSDEPSLETSLHLQQMMLLISCLNWLWRNQDHYFAAGNLTVYYNENQLKSTDYRGPDFFVVLGTEKKPRKSWVVWEEGGKYPNIIVELLSESTSQVDRGAKKEIYQDIFRTPDYFWFDPDSLEFAGFHLLDGTYEALQPNEQGWLWSQQLGLFLGVQDDLLRFFTPEKQLVLSPEEENERLAAKLRELGVDPDALT